MKKDNLVIYKPNELIEIVSRPISVVGLKAYNSILKKFQEEKKTSIIISPKDILTEIGSSDSYEELYTYLDELQKTQVKSIDKRGKLWGGFVLISEFKKVNGGISVTIPPTIYNALCSEEKKEKDLYYTAIKLLEQKSFKCSYSIVFYEIFKRYEKVEIPIYSIEDLKNLTKTTTTYKLFADFKKRVLLPALKEVNKYEAKYIYTHQEFKVGRKVEKIKFIKSLKEEDVQLSLKPTLSEKLLSAIEYAKKNRFIQAKFSQKAVDKAITQFGEELVIAGLKKLYSFEGKVSYFSRLLTSTIKEIQRSNEVNSLIPKKEETIAPAQVVNNELSDLDKLKSKVLAQAREQLKTNKYIDLSIEIVRANSNSEIDSIIKKYNLEFNLTLV